MIRRDKICGCSSSGRAPPCQGGGSEFEPRQPLQTQRWRYFLLCGNWQLRYRNLVFNRGAGPPQKRAFVGCVSEFEPRQPLQTNTVLMRSHICGCSSSGRAPPCQGGGSEFEPRQPLQKKTPVTDRCFLFGIRENITTFGRQSRPKVDAATRPRLAPARSLTTFGQPWADKARKGVKQNSPVDCFVARVIRLTAPVSRSLTKTALDGRILCLWAGWQLHGAPALYPQNAKKRAHPRCARFLIPVLRSAGAVSPPSCRYESRRPT